MSNKRNNFFNERSGKLIVYLVAIIILLVILCSIDTKYILPSIATFLCFTIYTIVIIYQREEELETQIKEITTSLDKVAKVAFMNAPIPLAIVNEKGVIIWNSNCFTDEFLATDIHAYIKEIMREYKVEVANNKGTQKLKIDSKIELGEKKLDIEDEKLRRTFPLIFNKKNGILSKYGYSIEMKKASPTQIQQKEYAKKILGEIKQTEEERNINNEKNVDNNFRSDDNSNRNDSLQK